MPELPTTPVVKAEARFHTANHNKLPSKFSFMIYVVLPTINEIHIVYENFSEQSVCVAVSSGIDLAGSGC